MAKLVCKTWDHRKFSWSGYSNHPADLREELYDDGWSWRASRKLAAGETVVKGGRLAGALFAPASNRGDLYYVVW